MIGPPSDEGDAGARSDEATTSGVTVREAGRGDEAIVAELVCELARAEGETAAATPELVAAYLDFPLSGALLGELDGEPVGLLTWFVRPGLYHGGRWGYIDELFVRERARRRGVADALLEAVMVRFADAGCVEASVSTMPDNEPAKTLYRKHGLVDEALLLERHF
jgi:ribosomal protein S18 acetylase RimI-like enzyme